jgi:hypothetical protein
MARLMRQKAATKLVTNMAVTVEGRPREGERKVYEYCEARLDLWRKE